MAVRAGLVGFRLTTRKSGLIRSQFLEEIATGSDKLIELKQEEKEVAYTLRKKEKVIKGRLSIKRKRYYKKL